MMGPDTTSRPLILHVSALSNEEFDLYTRYLQELATLDRIGTGSSAVPDGHYYEQLSFNAGETRAWLKGRYPYVTIEKIDSILKFMNSEDGPHDRLSGGQVLVALRLLTHLMAGEHVTKERAFYQALPRVKTALPSRIDTARIVRAQPPKLVSPPRHNNVSESPPSNQNLSTPTGLTNALPDQSASPSAANEPHIAERTSNHYQSSAPVATTHASTPASTPPNGADRLSTGHRPLATGQAEQPAASLSHSANGRLSNSQQPPTEAPRKPWPQTGIPPVPSHSNGSESLSAFDNQPGLTFDMLSPESFPQPSSSPPITLQSNKAVNSSGSLDSVRLTLMSRRSMKRKQSDDMAREDSPPPTRKKTRPDSAPTGSVVKTMRPTRIRG